MGLRVVKFIEYRIRCISFSVSVHSITDYNMGYGSDIIINKFLCIYVRFARNGVAQRDIVMFM